MDYVTVRELRDKSGEIWQRVEEGEEFVITRNGKPFALLVHTEPAAVEERLRALRAAQFGDLLRRLQAQAVDAGTAGMNEAAIQAEIAAARMALVGGEVRAAEPPAPPYRAKAAAAAAARPAAKRRPGHARGR